MKKVLFVLVLFFSAISGFSENAISRFIDAQQFKNAPFYGDIKTYKNRAANDDLDFAILYTIYKRRIITEREYANCLLRLSFTPKIMKIYEDRNSDLYRDLVFCEREIRIVLSQEELERFYANLLFVVPSHLRIGELDKYLHTQCKKASRPKIDLFKLLFDWS